MKYNFGFSLLDALAAIGILVVLGCISTFPMCGNPEMHKKFKLESACCSAKGIVKLFELIQVDERGSGDSNVCSWPTDAASLPRWMNTLTNYFGSTDLIRSFSAEDVKVTSWSANKGPNVNAYYIYPVTADSPANAILMTSRNYRLPTSGNGPALIESDKPFGTNGAIVVTKGGKAQVIAAGNATNDVSTIGIVEGAPLN